MIQGVLSRLRPSSSEIEAFALAEVDPANYSRFEPFTHGPIFALAVIAFVALCSLFVTPFRLLARTWRRH